MANLTVYVVMVARGVSPLHPAAEELIPWGADLGPLTTNGQWWRLLSSTFLHAGAWHLLGNMACLMWLGGLAERPLGKGRFLLIYLCGALSASLTSQVFHYSQVSVGASGAIFALAGFLVPPTLTGTMSLIDESEHPIKNLLKFSAYNLAIGLFVPFIDNSAHAGGFVYGLLVGSGFVMLRKWQSDDPRTATI